MTNDLRQNSFIVSRISSSPTAGGGIGQDFTHGKVDPLQLSAPLQKWQAIMIKMEIQYI